MSQTPIHDGKVVDASEVANIVCPGCGEKVGLNADKPHEGVDHPDCGFRFGIAAPAKPNTFQVTVNKLEVPIRTFAEDKKAKQEEAKEAKAEQQKEQQQQQQKESKDQRQSRR